MKATEKAKGPAITWAISLFIFIANIVVGTEFFRTTIDRSAYGKSQLAILVALVSFIVGCLSFALGFIIYVGFRLERKKGAHLRTRLVRQFIKLILVSLFLPIDVIVQAVRYKPAKSLSPGTKYRVRGLLIKLLPVLFSLVLLFPIWLSAYLATGIIGVTITEEKLGYKSSDYPIVGTGSMYPTFPKSDKKSPIEQYKDIVGSYAALPYPNGVVLFGKRYLGHEIQRGDIVTFRNEATLELTKKLYGEPGGFLKRVIALPGDTIEIKGGVVILNGQPLKEPYTFKPQSTFEESFLKECKQITVPPGKFFAMGDNRKGSGDSREIGFVDLKDIDHMIPMDSQKGILDKSWRDTSKDLNEESKIKLDKTRYLDLLNEKRKEANLRPLKYQQLLEQSATKRGEIMLKYNDFSWEATQSGKTMLWAMNSVRYSNIVYGEAPVLGYYEADELIENQFQFPKSKEFLLNKDYQEVGISEVAGEINGCPTQVIVEHFAGYVPPNYKQSDIDSWKKAQSNLRDIQPNWERLKTYESFYKDNKDDVDRITSLIGQRLNNITVIISRMEANQWLTAQERGLIDADKALSDEINQLADKLNKK